MTVSTEYHKRSFAQGRISRDFHARKDLVQYHEAAYDIHNMLTKAHGPVTTRPGTKFIYDLSNALQYAISEDVLVTGYGGVHIRLVPFVYSETQAYTIIFMQGATTSDLVVFFATDDGLIEDPASPGNPLFIHQVASVVYFDTYTFDYAQYNDVLFLALPDAAPQELIRNAHNSWTLQNQVLTAPPATWTVSNGYPSKVAIYEQRVVYGSSYGYPATLWFTRAGFPYDFSVSSPMVASDAVTVTIGGGRKDEMQWLSSQESLIVGSLGSEHGVSGKGYPLAYDTVSATKISQVSSKEVKQVEIGSDIVFVQAEGQRVFRYAYQYEAGNYRENDLSVLSYDITGSTLSFKSLAYQQQPYSIVWGVLSDGSFVSATIYGEHGVVAWHTHDTAGTNSSYPDSVVDVECIPKATKGTELWMATYRYIQTGYRVMLERMSYFNESSDILDYRVLDSYNEVSGASTVNMTHLKERTVTAVIDGVEYPNLTVPSSGTLTLVPDLVDSYTTAYVGLAFTQRLTPTPPDDARVMGGVGNRPISNREIILSVRNSGDGARVRITRENGVVQDEPIILRDHTVVADAAAPLYTGEVPVTIPFRIGRGPESEFSIIKENATPLTILGYSLETLVHT